MMTRQKVSSCPPYIMDIILLRIYIPQRKENALEIYKSMKFRLFLFIFLLCPPLVYPLYTAILLYFQISEKFQFEKSELK